MATSVPPSPATATAPQATGSNPTAAEQTIVDYLNLPCPIPYEEIHREALMSLKPELFEGMRFDFTKGLNQKFSLSHSVMMGPTEIPSQSSETIKIPTAHYEFGANFIDPKVVNLVDQRRNISCLAVQESSTSTVESVAAETREKTEAEGAAPPPAAAKTKPAAKPQAKPLPELMEEEVIPSLRATLEAQQDISDLELSFDENKLEGSFLKKGNPYTFWAFFPDGSINGPKGFSLSSYGSEVSTVEPFLVDEKKPTAKHVVFWVEKRLAAQGIIPVWKD